MPTPPPTRRSPRIPPRPRAFYNDINPYCAQWTRNLISAGLIPPGDVSTQSSVPLAQAFVQSYMDLLSLDSPEDV